MAEAQTGDGTALMVLPVFVAPALPTGAAPVNTGALNRIFAQVQDIKNGGKCSDKDARHLGITGSEQPGPDYTTLQPVFTVSIVGGQVHEMGLGRLRRVSGRHAKSRWIATTARVSTS